MQGVLLWFVTGLLAAGVVGLALIVYQLLRQQGRLLVRLERLEGILAAGQPARAPELTGGLAVGTPISFELPDLDGEKVSMERFRGKRVLLVHWSTTCGFCTKVAPELAELQDKLRARDVELVFVSYGDAEPNRALAAEYGLRSPILLQEHGQAITAFNALGTPVAYLIDEKGRVAEPLAIGANEVPELARATAEGRRRLASERSIAQSRIERDGLKAGTEAPGFELDDVRGGKVALEDYRGRRVLLVFSDPNCGPCDALLPELATLQDEINLILIGRGEREENRRKAEQHGLDFPVVLQKGWNLSKQYGIFATPVAFLVDEEGVIARDVARGKDEIVGIAREAPAGKEAELAL